MIKPVLKDIFPINDVYSVETGHNDIVSNKPVGATYCN